MALGLTPQEIVNKGEYQLLSKAEKWERVTLSDVAKIQNGFAFKSSFFDRHEGMELIRIRDICKSYTEHRYTGEYAQEYVVNAGDILVGMDGDFTAAKWQGKSALLNQRVCRLSLASQCMDEKFFFLCLQPYLNAINVETSSVTVKHLSSKTICNIPLPLPPLNEQKRIVAKIEELFSELDNGIAALKTAREQLKVYRQAVLKHAFEGKLTAQWREDNKDKLESPEQLLTRIQQEREVLLNGLVINGDLEAKRFLTKIKKAKPSYPNIDLAKNAKWVSLIDICTLIVDCHNKTAPYENQGIWLIRTPCIKYGKIRLNDEARFISEETYDYWAKRCPPKPGDIIFTREAPMGEVGVVPDNTKLCMGQRMMLLRRPSIISSKYLLYSMMEPGFTARMNESAVGTGVKHLRVSDVEKLCIPLFSLDEQSAIVEILDSKLSLIDEQDEEISDSIAKAETLHQSILKKAFSGQLVAQDPNDEPASELLARILTEKLAEKAKQKAAKKPAVKRSRKKKIDSLPLPGAPKLKPVELQAGIIALALHHYKNNPDYLRYFHRTKGEKIVHLAESHLGIDLERDPIKDAAGPVDFDRIRESEDYAKQSAFFKCVKQKTARGNTYYNYQPMQHFDQLVVSTKQQLGEKLADVQHLLTLLAPLSTQKTEVVTTLYAAWNNLLLEGNKQPDDEQIVTQAREQWHENKLRIERTLFFTQLEWMRSKALIPVGKGKKVLQKLGTTGSLF